MGKLKIETIINSCNDCRYIIRTESQKGGFYAAICTYNSKKNYEAVAELDDDTDVGMTKEDILLMTSSVDDTKNYSIDIPPSCPLEDYLPTFKTIANKES